MEDIKYPEERKSEHIEHIMRKYEFKNKKKQKPFLKHRDLYVNGNFK